MFVDGSILNGIRLRKLLGEEAGETEKITRGKTELESFNFPQVRLDDFVKENDTEEWVYDIRCACCKNPIALDIGNMLKIPHTEANELTLTSASEHVVKVKRHSTTTTTTHVESNPVDKSSNVSAHGGQHTLTNVCSGIQFENAALASVIHNVLKVDSTPAKTLNHVSLDLKSTVVSNYADDNPFWDRKETKRIQTDPYRAWYKKNARFNETRHKVLIWYLKSYLDDIEKEFYDFCGEKLKREKVDDAIPLSDTFETVIRLGKTLNRNVHLKESGIPIEMHDAYGKRQVNLLDSYHCRNITKKVYLKERTKGNVFYYLPSEYELVLEDALKRNSKPLLSEAFLSCIFDTTEIADLEAIGLRTASFSKVMKDLGLGDVIKRAVNDTVESTVKNVSIYLKVSDVSQTHDEWVKNDKKLEGERIQTLRTEMKKSLLVGMGELMKRMCTWAFDQGFSEKSSASSKCWSVGVWYAVMYLLVKNVDLEFVGDGRLDQAVTAIMSKYDSTSKVVPDKELENVITGVIGVKDEFAGELNNKSTSCTVLLALNDFEGSSSLSRFLLPLLRAKIGAKSSNELDVFLDGLDGLTSMEDGEGDGDYYDDKTNEGKKNTVTIQRNGSLIIKACKLTTSSEHEDVQIGKPMERTYEEARARFESKIGWIPYGVKISENMANNKGWSYANHFLPAAGTYFVNEPSEYIYLTGRGKKAKNDKWECDRINSAGFVLEGWYQKNVEVNPFPLTGSNLCISFGDLKHGVRPILKKELNVVMSEANKGLFGLKTLLKNKNKWEYRDVVKSFGCEMSSDRFEMSNEVILKRKSIEKYKKIKYFLMMLEECEKNGGDGPMRLEWHKGGEYKGRESMVSINDLNLIVHRSASRNETDTVNNVGIYTAWMVDASESNSSPNLYSGRSEWSSMVDISTKDSENEKLQYSDSTVERTLKRDDAKYAEGGLFVTRDFKAPVMARLATIRLVHEGIVGDVVPKHAAGDPLGLLGVEYSPRADLVSHVEEGEMVDPFPVHFSSGEKSEGKLELESAYSRTSASERFKLKLLKKNSLTETYEVEEKSMALAMEYGTVNEFDSNRFEIDWADRHRYANVRAESWMASSYLWIFHGVAIELPVYADDGSKGISPESFLGRHATDDDSMLSAKLSHSDPLLREAFENAFRKKHRQLEEYWVSKLGVSKSGVFMGGNEVEISKMNRSAYEHLIDLLVLSVSDAGHEEKIKTDGAYCAKLVSRLSGAYHSTNKIWLTLFSSTGEPFEVYHPMRRFDSFGTMRPRYRERSGGLMEHVDVYTKYIVSLLKRLVGGKYESAKLLKYEELFGNGDGAENAGFALIHNVYVKTETVRPCVGIAEKPKGRSNDPTVSMRDFYADIARKWLMFVLRNVRIEDDYDDDGKTYGPPFVNLLDALNDHCTERARSLKFELRSEDDPNNPAYVPPRLRSSALPLDVAKEEKRKRHLEAFRGEPAFVRYVDSLHHDFLEDVMNVEGSYGRETLDELVSAYSDLSAVAYYELIKSDRYGLRENSNEPVKIDPTGGGGAFHRIYAKEGKIYGYDRVYYKNEVVFEIYDEACRIVRELKRMLLWLTKNVDVRKRFNDMLNDFSMLEASEHFKTHERWKDVGSEGSKDRYRAKMSAALKRRFGNGNAHGMRTQCEPDAIRGSFDGRNDPALIDSMWEVMDIERYLDCVYDVLKEVRASPSKRYENHDRDRKKFDPHRGHRRRESMFFVSILSALEPIVGSSLRSDVASNAWVALEIMDDLVNSRDAGERSIRTKYDSLYSPPVVRIAERGTFSLGKKLGESGSHADARRVFGDAFPPWLRAHALVSETETSEADTSATKYGRRRGILDDYFPGPSHVRASAEDFALNVPSIRNDFVARGGDVANIRARQIERDPAYAVLSHQFHRVVRDYYKLLERIQSDDFDLKDVSREEYYEKLKIVYVRKWELILKYAEYLK